MVRAGNASATLNPSTQKAVQFTLEPQAKYSKQYISSNYVLGVYMNSNNEIIVTYKNEKIDDGSYNLQIIKKSESSNWNEASNDTSEAVSNATYAIKQYLNINDFDSPGELETYLKAFTSNDEEITTTNTWKEVYQNWIKMDKFSVGLVDIYAINESKAPTGYEKNNNTIYLKVKKKINNGYYCIDYVAFLNTATGEELSADGIYLKSKEIDGMTYLIHEGWNIKVAYNLVPKMHVFLLRKLIHQLIHTILN